MRFFVTGATGYIGGSVAEKLRDSGHEVLGLVRSVKKARLLKKRGITPILGTLDEADILTDGARQADGVINAASADHPGAVETLVAALECSGKLLIHTSGSSIVADESLHEYPGDADGVMVDNDCADNAESTMSSESSVSRYTLGSRSSQTRSGREGTPYGAHRLAMALDLRGCFGAAVWLGACTGAPTAGRGLRFLAPAFAHPSGSHPGRRGGSHLGPPRLERQPCRNRRQAW